MTIRETIEEALRLFYTPEIAADLASLKMREIEAMQPGEERTFTAGNLVLTVRNNERE